MYIKCDKVHEACFLRCSIRELFKRYSYVGIDFILILSSVSSNLFRGIINISNLGLSECNNRILNDEMSTCLKNILIFSNKNISTTKFY